MVHNLIKAIVLFLVISVGANASYTPVTVTDGITTVKGARKITINGSTLSNVGGGNLTINTSTYTGTHFNGDLAQAIGVSVQAYSPVLANTTASFTTADETKLDGIAVGAEVNVNADWNSVSGDSQILNKPTIPTQYTDELAQDAIGTILVDSAELDLTYNDATPSITASLVVGSIDESKLDTSVNASLDLADSALQSEVDGSVSNELQTLSFSSPNISISSGNSVNISSIDTNSSTICSGTTTYLDGEGNCDNIATVYQPLVDNLTLLSTNNGADLINVIPKNITNFIDNGSNITFTGVGTLASPYVISGVVPNSFSTQSTPAGTAPVADSSSDTLSWVGGTGITITGDSTTDTITITTADTSATNEIQNLFQTFDAPSGTDPVADSSIDTLTFTAGGIVTITGNSTTDTITISASEVDGSTTNELQNIFQTVSTSSGTAPVADTTTDTITFTGGGIVTVTGDSTTDTVTFAATEVDGSTTNELQNLFSTISTTSGTAPVADSTTDTLTLTAGSGITITGDSTTDTITIAATGGGGGTPGGSNTWFQFNDSGSFAGNGALAFTKATKTLTVPADAPLDINSTTVSIADTNIAFDGASTTFTGTGAMTITPGSGTNLNVSLATTGDFAVNTSQLYVDTSTTNVGVGFTLPNSKLAVNGDVSMKEMSASTAASGFGKLYTNSADSELYFDADDQTAVKITNNGSLATTGGGGEAADLYYTQTFPGVSGFWTASGSGSASYLVSSVNITANASSQYFLNSTGYSEDLWSGTGKKVILHGGNVLAQAFGASSTLHYRVMLAGDMSTCDDLTYRGFGFNYKNGTIMAVNSNGGGSETETSTGVTVGEGFTMQTVKAVYTIGTDIKFYVGDVLKATHTTNLPTAWSNSQGPIICVSSKTASPRNVYALAPTVQFSHRDL